MKAHLNKFDMIPEAFPTNDACPLKSARAAPDDRQPHRAVSRGRPGRVGDDRQAELAQGLQRCLQVRRQARGSGRLTQDIFLKIFKALATFDRRELQTWIISISRNLCIDHYRSVRKERQTIAREVDTSDLQPASSDRTPYAAAEHQDLRETLRQALRVPPLRFARPSCSGPAGAVVPGDRRPSRAARGDGEVAHQPRALGTGATIRMQDKQPVTPSARPPRPRGRRSSDRMNLTTEHTNGVAIVASGNRGSCTRCSPSSPMS